MYEELRKRLEKLGSQKLAELLIEFAAQHAAIEERLNVITANDQELLKSVKTQISGLNRIRKFHNYEAVGRLGDKITLVLESLTKLKADPKTRCEMLFSFYRTDKAVFDHCNDSSGMLSYEYRHTARDILKAAGAACEDKEWLAREICELIAENGYGARDGILTIAGSVLPEPLIRKMISDFHQQAKSLDSASTEKEAWRKPGQRCWNHAIELAAGIKDAELHEALYTEALDDRAPHPTALIEIAKVYLAAGKPQIALERLDQIHNENIQATYNINNLRMKAHGAIGKPANKKAIETILRRRFISVPTKESLDSICEYLTAAQQKKLLKDLVDHYEGLPDLDPHFLEFATNELNTQVAKKYLFERLSKLDGDSYYSVLARVAKTFSENGEPLAATLIYRALAESLLIRAQSKNYGIAVGYIEKAKLLAKDIKAWQSHDDHDQYMEKLKSRYARKSAFWAKMN